MKKLIFITIIVLLSYFRVYGQISTSEEPISFRTDVPTLRANEKTQIISPSLNMEKIQQEDKEDEANGIPPRFGYIHDVSLNLENSGEWTILSDGNKIWRLTLHCPNALSVNLLYDKFWLPDGAKFFVYSNDRRHSIGAFTSVNNKGSRSDVQGFATGLVYGDQVTLEYLLPNDVKEVGIISISGIVHGYRYILPNKYGYGNVPGNDPNNLFGFNQSGNCQVNINCPEGNNWQNEKRAVALIIVNGNRNCTGSLINNANNDHYPYFLTANHCLGLNDATNKPNLNHWTFYWNYELPPNPNNCNYNNSNPSEPLAFSTSGAQILANNSASDFALLKLSEDPKYFINHTPSFIPYYLGWDRSGNSGTGGVGIHHPRGDIKKISTYTMTPQSTDYLSNTVNVNDNHWKVIWVQTITNHSVTEKVSSGSPLINSNKSVIGQLHGGYAACVESDKYGKNSPDWYGKFNVSWTGGGTNSTRLSNWLDPNNTYTTLIGIDSCPTPINFTGTVTNPIIVTTSTTVTNPCGDINVQNVKVQNGAKLTLDAAGDVNIIGDFEVDLGSEFEIK